MKRKKNNLFQKIALGLIFSLGFFALSGVARAEEVVEEINLENLEESSPGEMEVPSSVEEMLDTGMREATEEETKELLESLNGEQIDFIGSGDPKDVDPFLTISIENLKIVSQKNNVFEITFEAVNENPHSRNGIIYGVFLNRVNEENTLSPYYGEARQIYEERLNIGEHSRISRTIEYTAPDYLSGEYLLSVELYKDNGLYLGGQQLDESVKLEGINNILEIVPSSCTIEVGEGENGRSYSPNGEASLNPQEEKVFGICKVINHSDQSVEFTQNFKISKESILKDQKAQNIHLEMEKFQMEPQEDSWVAFSLPTEMDPQFYEVEVSLKDGGKTISNPVIMRYFLQGASVTIQDLIFDMPFYSTGEEALAVLYLSFYPGQSEEEKSLDCDLIIKDKTDGQVCGQASQELKIDETEFEMNKTFGYTTNHNHLLDYVVPISKECQNPVASITAKDKNGKILAQEDIEIIQGEKSQEKLVQDKKSISLLILALVSALIVLVFLFVILKKK